MKSLYRFKRPLIFISILGVLIIAAICPFELVMAPERKLHVVDRTGKPIVNAMVWQGWNQYSLGEGGEERFATDTEGRVTLPKRVVRTTFLSLLKGALTEFKSVGIHASYFSREFVAVRVEPNLVKISHNGKGLESGEVIIDLDKR